MFFLAGGDREEMDRNRTSETVKLHDAVKIQEQEKLSWAKMQDCFSWIWYVRFQTTNQIRPREKQGCRGFGIILCSCYLILFFVNSVIEPIILLQHEDKPCYIKMPQTSDFWCMLCKVYTLTLAAALHFTFLFDIWLLIDRELELFLYES